MFYVSSKRLSRVLLEINTGIEEGRYAGPGDCWQEVVEQIGEAFKKENDDFDMDDFFSKSGYWI